MPPIRTRRTRHPILWKYPEIHDTFLPYSSRSKHGEHLMRIREFIDPDVLHRFARCEGRPGVEHKLEINMGLQNPHNFGRLTKSQVSNDDSVTDGLLTKCAIPV